MQRTYTLNDYFEIIVHRKWYLIVPSLVMCLLATGVSFIVPPKYTSQTLVLVEQPKVAESLVKPSVTIDLDRRLSTMKEQILSRTRLEPIIQRFGLYKEEKNGKKSLDDLVEKVRKQIKVEPIRGANGSTPGFFISFTWNNPKTAHDVCTEITSLFMEENLKLREEQSIGTTQFLAAQLEDAKKKLDEQDAKLAVFKQKYMGQMPEQEQLNMNMLTSLKSQLDATTEALSRARQDKSYTVSMLAQQKAAWDRDQSRGNGESGAVPVHALDAQLAAKRAELSSLLARYTPDHPDVIKVQAEINRMEQMEESNAASTPVPSGNKKARVEATYPKEIESLQGSIHLLDETIESKAAEQSRLQAEIQKYEGRLQMSPVVEEQMKELTRDYQIASVFYQDLLSKETQSEMSTDLERRQESEQFRIMDPANMPGKPSFPIPGLFSAVGLVFGLAIGAFIVYFLDFASRTIRSGADIEFYLKLPVLVIVPENGPAKEREKKTSFVTTRKKPAEAGA